MSESVGNSLNKDERAEELLLSARSNLEYVQSPQSTPKLAASRRISSAPIPVHVTATLFDTPSKAECIDNKPLLVRFGRRLVTSIVGMWMRLAGRCLLYTSDAADE